MGGEIFVPPPVQTIPAAQPAFCTKGTGSFPGVKRQRRGVDHPPPSSAEVKEKAELYLYSPCGPSCPVLGRTLAFITSHGLIPGIKGVLRSSVYLYKYFNNNNNNNNNNNTIKAPHCSHTFNHIKHCVCGQAFPFNLKLRCAFRCSLQITAFLTNSVPLHCLPLSKGSYAVTMESACSS